MVFKKNRVGVKDSLTKSMREMAPFMNIGLQMALPVVGCVFLGLWLDNKYDTSPLWILVGSAFGLFAGFYYFFKTVSRKNKE